MTAWIGFFFGGFFVNKFAIDGVHRSVRNAVFAAVICLALIYFGLSRDTVYSLSIAIFSAIMLVRSATLALPRYIYGRKQKRAQDLDDKFFLGDNDA